uniref:Uncharacterized protein n=1 Tax=Rhizophora mucronata TaxID=61149 RepID=A0A2P2K7P9_RHIMU
MHYRVSHSKNKTRLLQRGKKNMRTKFKLMNYTLLKTSVNST